VQTFPRRKNGWLYQFVEIDRAFTPLVEVERNQAPLRAYGEEE